MYTLKVVVLCALLALSLGKGYGAKNEKPKETLSVPSNLQPVDVQYQYADNDYDCFYWKEGSQIKVRETANAIQSVPLAFGYSQEIGQDDLIQVDEKGNTKKIGQVQAMCFSFEGTPSAPLWCNQQMVFYCHDKVVGIIASQGKYPMVGDVSPFSLTVVGASGCFDERPNGVIKAKQSADASAWDYVIQLKGESHHEEYY
eukprot:TRINITY_DN735_c0_g1_i2.p2 TRINITY_DN735_c0_g1~~TRINITY_DN735_c0_g1_i2.p2  ORF type:complete len:200 (-),score=58.69 TRINITY_DN735_c0_g1_i2:43-642(-)